MSEIKEIEIEKIREPRNAARLDPKDDSIYELAESILAVGLINPLTVRQVDNGNYEVIAGHRRLLACQLAGLKKVPCIIKKADEELADTIMLTENTARKDMTPIEEAAKLLELQKRKDLGIGALARIVGRSKSWVRQRLDLLKIRPELVSNNTLKMWLRTYEEAKKWEEEWEEEFEKQEKKVKDYDLRGRCQICGDKFEYEKLTTLVVCRECRFHLMKAVKEAEQDERIEDGAVSHIETRN